MPFTPYTGTIGFEYKPLGLEQFAAPLAKMQEGYDTTQQKIDALDFDVNSLSVDDETKKKILDEFHRRKGELANELMTTKNYREAARKAYNLNQLYQKDAVLKGIQSNYKAFNDWDKEQKERVKSGKLRQDEYELNRARVLSEYKHGKGVNYIPGQPDDQINSINLHTLHDDLEDDFRKDIREFANMTPEQRRSKAATMGFDPAYLQLVTTATSEKFKDKDWVSNELYKAIATSDKYKAWMKDRADLQLDSQKYTMLNNNPSAYNDYLKQQYLNQYDNISQSIQNIKQRAAKGDKSAINYINSGGLENLAQQQTALRSALQQETLDDKDYRNQFTNQFIHNKIKSHTDAVGDLIDYRYYDVDKSFKNPADAWLKQHGYGDQTEEGSHVEFNPLSYTEGVTYDSLKENIDKSKTSGKNATTKLGAVFNNMYKYGHDKGQYNLYEQEKQARILLNAYQKSKGDYNTFRNSYLKAGGDPKKSLYEQFKFFKDSNNLINFKQGLNELNKSNEELRQGQTMWNQSEEDVHNDENFKLAMEGVGKTTATFTNENIPKELIPFAKASTGRGGEVTYTLNADNYAKFKGYKSAYDGLQHGLKFPSYFSNVKADGLGNKNDIDESLTNVYGNSINEAFDILKEATRKQHLDRQSFGSELIVTGNTKADKEFMARTNNILDAHIGASGENLDSFKTYSPIKLKDDEEKEDWVKKGKSTLFILSDGTVGYKVPMKNTKNDRASFQLVKPRKGTMDEGKMIEVLQNVINNMSDSDPQKDIAKAALFRTLNPAPQVVGKTLDKTTVYKDSPMVIEEFRGPDGSKMRTLKKSYKSKGEEGSNNMYYSAEQFINGKWYPVGSNGQEFKSSDYQKMMSFLGGTY